MPSPSLLFRYRRPNRQAIPLSRRLSSQRRHPLRRFLPRLLSPSHSLYRYQVRRLLPLRCRRNLIPFRRILPENSLEYQRYPPRRKEPLPNLTRTAQPHLRSQRILPSSRLQTLRSFDPTRGGSEEDSGWECGKPCRRGFAG